MAETAGIELFHGYTYSAHPLACAAALATLDLYRDEALFARARSLEVALGGGGAHARRCPPRHRYS